MNDDRSADWRKSSYSNSSANCVEITVRWRKSSHSGDDGDCIEVCSAEHAIGVRDSKMHGGGPVLEFTAAAWREFVGAARSGRLSR
jgi:hypothetical protein